MYGPTGLFGLASTTIVVSAVTLDRMASASGRSAGLFRGHDGRPLDGGVHKGHGEAVLADHHLVAGTQVARMSSEMISSEPLPQTMRAGSRPKASPIADRRAAWLPFG